MFGFVFRLFSRIIGFVVKAAIFAAVLVVAAGGVMYALFDGEQYKRALSQRVVDVTGRTLAIDGPAELQLGLRPRLVLNDVRIGNPRWASRRDMARIRRLEIELDPLSAVSGNSSLAQLRADGADITLETGQLGEGGNWESFAIGAAAQAVVAALGLGLFAAPIVPSVIVSNTTVTVLPGPGTPTAPATVVSLGTTALQVSGSSFPAIGASSPVLLAARSDRENPCETEEERQNRAERQRPAEAPRAQTPPRPATR